MLNTLANHGFLPHDGKNITEEITIKALDTALNIDAELGKFLFDFAATTNPEPNATEFSLDHLSRHNILEHDASLRSVIPLLPSSDPQSSGKLLAKRLTRALRALKPCGCVLCRPPGLQPDCLRRDQVVLEGRCHQRRHGRCCPPRPRNHFRYHKP